MVEGKPDVSLFQIADMVEAKFLWLANHLWSQAFQRSHRHDTTTTNVTRSRKSQMADIKIGSSKISSCNYARNNIPPVNPPFSWSSIYPSHVERTKIVLQVLVLEITK